MNHDSQHGSDSSEEDSSDGKSPPRGRTGKSSADTESVHSRQVDAQIDSLMGENSKASGA